MTYGDITYATLTGGGNGGNAYQVRLGYQVLSEDVSNNRRQVKLQLEVRSVKSAYGTYGFNQTTTIDGSTLSSATFDMRNTNVWQVFGSRTITINGAYNGYKSGSFVTDATTSSGNYTLKNGSANVYISLASLHMPPELTLSSITENSSKLSGIDGTTFVNNISEKTFTLNYTMYDSATASSLKIYDKNGNELTATTSLSTTSGTITVNFKDSPISSNAITNNKTTFIIKFTDSLNGSKSITTSEYTVIPYFAPNLITTASNVKRNGQTTGKAILNLTGQFYNATVGNTVNNISLSFKYWTGSAEPSTYYPITIDNEKVIVSGNNITANKYEFKKNNVVVEDLDKSNSYKFKIKAVDSFGSEYEAEIELTLAKGEWIMAKFKDRVDFKKITITGDEVHAKKVIYDGSLTGTDSTTLTNVKRFLDVYVWINFGSKDGTFKYTIDTTKDNPVYGSGYMTPFDENNMGTMYVSEASYNNGTFTHTRIGYVSLSTGTFTERASNQSYVIYRIETYD